MILLLPLPPSLSLSLQEHHPRLPMQPPPQGYAHPPPGMGGQPGPGQQQHPPMAAFSPGMVPHAPPPGAPGYPSPMRHPVCGGVARGSDIHTMYCMAVKFRGAKFSRIGNPTNFAEIIFVDQGHCIIITKRKFAA